MSSSTTGNSGRDFFARPLPIPGAARRASVDLLVNLLVDDERPLVDVHAPGEEPFLEGLREHVVLDPGSLGGVFRLLGEPRRVLRARLIPGDDEDGFRVLREPLGASPVALGMDGRGERTRCSWAWWWRRGWPDGHHRLGARDATRVDILAGVETAGFHPADEQGAAVLFRSVTLPGFRLRGLPLLLRKGSRGA